MKLELEIMVDLFRKVELAAESMNVSGTEIIEIALRRFLKQLPR